MLWTWTHRYDMSLLMLQRSTRCLCTPESPLTLNRFAHGLFYHHPSAVEDPPLKMPKSTARTSPLHHCVPPVSYQHGPSQAGRLLELPHLAVRHLCKSACTLITKYLAHTIIEIRRFGVGAPLDHGKLDLLEVLTLDTCPLLQALLCVGEFLALFTVRIAKKAINEHDAYVD